MSKKYIFIEADVNDGDYISELNQISDKDLEIIKPVIKAIKANKKGHNYDVGGYDDTTPEDKYVSTGKCTQEELDTFDSFVPVMDNQEVHTIESIRILIVEKEIDLL